MFYFYFCGVVVLCRSRSSDHLMHIMRGLLNFGYAIDVVNVCVVLLFGDLTTAESRVKAWRQ